ncbi:MAG: glutathione S-transferase family protein [Xanthobacteraceae bacterium]|nr:glutathione S-transferase family protein [Xanthobacteraceae bacterium]QYK44619.1 MAG: glutathione S-transferase family protein [Xanthobacteraceae bacterium]
MTLRLHFHPLSSYCHKVLIALYENGTAFEPVVLNLMDKGAAAEFRKISPFGKMPALEDTTRGHVVNEATTVIEYLDAHYPGAIRFVPADADEAWQTRMWDRFFDNYLHDSMQRVVADSFRSDGSHDPYSVAECKKRIFEFYALLDWHMKGREWIGRHFSLADCAASPSLFYANTIYPLGKEYPEARAYLGRLMGRPSYSRALAEAEPFFNFFPLDPKPQRKLAAA